MSRILNRILGRLNLVPKDRNDFIKEIKNLSGGNSDQRLNTIENTLLAITEGSEIEQSINVQWYVFDDDLENNLNIINELSVTDNYKVKYKLSETDILDCIYYNGVLTCVKENNIVQYDVNFNTGEIKRKTTIYTELIGYEVRLDVCTSGSTEADRNLELLNKAYFTLGDHFTVNIDAGIGVAKFIPSQGGRGHITTADGVNVFYNIGEDGSVVKDKEIDLEDLYNKISNL